MLGAARACPPAWLPEAHEGTVIAGAGDQAAGALGVGVASGRRLSVVLGTSGVVFAPLPAFRADPQARVHAFCHAVPGTWHAMGVMLSAAGSLGWLRRRARGGLRAAARRGGGLASGRRGRSFRPTWRASARRTLTPTPAAPSPGSRCGTTAARSCARCSRGWRSACATRSSCSSSSASSPSRVGSPAAGAQRPLAADRRVRARPAARADGGRGGRGVRRGAARRRRRRASSARRKRRSPPASGCARPSTPSPRGPARTKRHTLATARSIPRSRRSDESRREGRSRHRCEPGDRRRRARALSAEGVRLGLASRSGDEPRSRRRRRAAVRCARPRSGAGAGGRDGGAVRPARHPRRERGRRGRTARSSISALTCSTR